METLFSQLDTTASLTSAVVITLSAIALALIISLVYMFTHRRAGYSPTIIGTLLLLAPAASIIMVLVGNSVSRALAVGSGITLIRYRSNFSDQRDLAYIYTSMAVGVSCGLGFIGYAVVFVLLICALLLILHGSRFGIPGDKYLRLKILVPENLNYYGAFDETLDKYTAGHSLTRVKTTDYGTAFELSYLVALKDIKEQKDFIDELRTKNGNMTVMLTHRAEEVE